MRNVLVVFNYNAGRKKAVLYKKLIHKFLLKRCNKFKFINIRDFDSSDLQEYDTIFAVGGDGTVNQIANYAAQNSKNMAIIPGGTANLLAAKLGIPTNIKKALEVIDKNNIRNIDSMVINGLPCFLRCGFGYDADIICKTPQSLKNKFGYFAYFIAGILFALRLKPKIYDITFDGTRRKTTATCMIIANAANMYKNVVSIANDSEPDDGLIDVFIMKIKNPVTFFYEFLKIIFNVRTNNPRARYMKVKNITIKNNWAVCHIDGEKIKLKDDISIGIIPNSLRIYAN